MKQEDRNGMKGEKKQKRLKERKKTLKEDNKTQRETSSGVDGT